MRKSDLSLMPLSARLTGAFVKMRFRERRLTFKLSIARLIPLLILLAFYHCSGAMAANSVQAGKALPLYKTRNILFSRIALEDGLSQAAVNSIAQDQQGYIWFGTQEGLNRYDGNDITVYEHDLDDPRSLSNDWVWTLFVDQAQTLWIGTDGGGLNRFDREQKSFTHFRHNPDDPHSLSNDRVRVIYQDRQGVYWIGTDGGGLNRFHADTGRFIRYQNNPENSQSLGSDTVLAIHEDRNGTLWVGTKGGGLASFDRASGTFTHYRHDPNVATSLSDDRVRSIYEDRDGRLWIGTYEAGLNIFDAKRGHFTRFQHDANDPKSLSHNRIRDVYQDRDGTLWVATDGGLNEWLPETQNFTHYNHDSTDPSSLSDDRVISISQDRGGVLWVGTFNGVNKWNYVSDAFVYFKENGSQLKISSNIVTSVSESADSKIWVGTYGGGLNRLDLESGTVTNYAHSQADVHSLSDNRVMTIFNDQDHIVWVGTRNGGLNRLDPESGKITHYRHDPQDKHSLSADSVTSILGEANGVLWMGTYGGGLNRFDSHSGKFTVFRHDTDDPKTLGSDRVLAIYRDSSSVLWIGTEDGGLNRFDEGNQSFTRYVHNPDDATSLGSDAAWAIFEGSDGSLWVGTGGGGLNRWMPSDRIAGKAVFRKYRKNEGLRSDTVQGMLEDNAGFLWLSSNRGLVRLDPDSGDTRHYDSKNGLKGNEFNFAACLRSHNNRMFFGGNTGLVAFYPEQMRANRHRPDIALTAYSRLGPLGGSYSTLPDDTSIELGYRDDLITFAFAGLDYGAPEKNLYRYKLEGFDRDWSNPALFRRTTYTNLPTGSYTFRVTASNNDGMWNERGTSIQLKVIPPPWKTMWAYAIYTLIVGACIAAYLRAQRLKLTREKNQRIELERQVKLRTQEIAERNEQLLMLNTKLKDASWTDSLTGLKNRRYMDEFIEAEVALVNRRAKDLKQSGNSTTPLDISPALSFMMIDLDGFKTINDTHGHHAGDQALLQVRDILETCCRKSDTIIRWGGDEFLIVGHNTTIRSAERLAERIRIGLAEHQYQLGGGNVGRLSGSIGIALYPFSSLKPDAISWEQVTTVADRAAYAAKNNGRNAWVGIYGARNFSSKECALIKNDLDILRANKRVSLNTSVEGELILAEERKDKWHDDRVPS